MGAYRRLGRRLRGALIDAYLGGRFAGLRRRAHSAFGGDTLELCHQVDDPHSHLLVQCLGDTVRDARLNLSVCVVPPPVASADPQPALRRALAIGDARELSRRYQLTFPDDALEPPADLVAGANAVMLYAREPLRQLEVAQQVGDALWRGDGDSIAALRERVGAVDDAEVASLLDRNARRRRSSGHYQGAMLRYRGEWYWGVDRLPLLQEQLRAEGHTVRDTVVARTDREPPAVSLSGEPELELFYSFRSPYSYLAVERSQALARRYDVPLRIKPVLPMVMRGLAVPRVKRMYIVRDVAREARRLGVPFGRICDPVGVGVARCLAIFVLAHEQQCAFDFVSSAGRGIWSEALDMASDEDLQLVAERAGLSWSDAQRALKSEAWRELAEANRVELFAQGLWGVPSFRIGDYAVWGQDRLDAVEERLAAVRGAS